MARPLRIEFPGAVYHITARGDRREPIFEDDEDRLLFLSILGRALERFDAQCLAYCLMGNHYHFVLHTRQANLSQLMRHVNGVYTQAFNRRHNKVGHLFQGRFKAILVDRDAYLLEVCRYVERNPVAARMVRQPQNWPWSSYRAHAGIEPSSSWLDTEGLYGYLLGRTPASAADHRRAAKRYTEFVAADPENKLWDTALRQQIYLGDEKFVDRMQTLAGSKNSTDRDIPKVQKHKLRSLSEWMKSCATREEALYRAHTESALSMSAMARELGLSVSRVSRLIARAEQAKGKA